MSDEIQPTAPAPIVGGAEDIMPKAPASFKVPDECGSCGAPLKDVPVTLPQCPHCGHAFGDDSGTGHAQWSRLPRSLRDVGN